MRPAESGQRALHLLDAVALDDVVHLHVVIAGDLEAALEPLLDLADVVLVVLERLQPGRLRTVDREPPELPPAYC